VLEPSVHVGALAVVEAGARIGANSVIGGGAYIGEDTVVGENCRIYPNVTIRERCILGNRVAIHPGTVIGGDGFGYEQTPQGHRKVPQVGFVQIDDDVEIGALVAVDRARFGKTWIKRGVKVDNLVQIAHNVVIHEHALIVAQVGISGSTSIGAGCVLAGQAGVAGHLTVGAGTVLGGRGGIIKDAPPGSQLMGMPAVDKREYVKQLTAYKGVERCRREIDALKAEIAELKALLASRA
jgi:UDP-3-O-[3-hydroxymyristoyl] glucosamine N-acyltransferase